MLATLLTFTLHLIKISDCGDKPAHLWKNFCDSDFREEQHCGWPAAAAPDRHKLWASFSGQSLKIIQQNSHTRPPTRQRTSCLKHPVQYNCQKHSKSLASKRETIFPVAPRWLPRIESRSDWAARAKCLPHSASCALIGRCRVM